MINLVLKHEQLFQFYRGKEVKQQTSPIHSTIPIIKNAAAVNWVTIYFTIPDILHQTVIVYNS